MFHKKSRKDCLTRRLGLEKLEDRRMLAAVTVSINSDVIDGTVINGLLGPDGLISNPGPDGKISLREAIEAANREQSADTILFDSTLSGDTITLTQGQFSLYDSVTIDSDNQNITIDATGNSSRIFDISTFPGFPSIEYEIKDLTLTGGNSNLGGGAIRSENVNLTLRNTTITGNSSLFGQGGGISFEGDSNSLKIYSSTISNNSFTYAGGRGGGALITGTNSSVVIGDGTIISGNTASGVGANGGGVFLSLTGSGSSVDIINSTISGNKALGLGSNGGGMYLEANGFNVVLDDLQVLGNEADDDGGGLFFKNNGGDILLQNSTITGNIAKDNGLAGGGGGLYLVGSNGAVTTVENSAFASNEAIGSSGGALFVEGDSQTVTIVNTTISENLAGDRGGGALISGSNSSIVISGGTIFSENVVNGLNGNCDSPRLTDTWRGDFYAAITGA